MTLRYPALRSFVAISYFVGMVVAAVVFALLRDDHHWLWAAAAAVLAPLAIVAFADLMRVLMDAESHLRALRDAAARRAPPAPTSP